MHVGENKNFRQDQFIDIITHITNFTHCKYQYPEVLTCFFTDFQKKEIPKPNNSKGEVQ